MTPTPAVPGRPASEFATHSVPGGELAHATQVAIYQVFTLRQSVTSPLRHPLDAPEPKPGGSRPTAAATVLGHGLRRIHNPAAGVRSVAAGLSPAESGRKEAMIDRESVGNQCAEPLSSWDIGS